jgi:hypothetical protein
MKHIQTEITIDATPDTVWGLLTDFATYPEWNPFITRIEGEPTLGARLEADLQPAGRKQSTFKPTVTVVEPGRHFEWLGGTKGIFTGAHRFELESVEGGTRFIQSERFAGALSGLIMRMIGTQTEAGFVAMNEALKVRAESR